MYGARTYIYGRKGVKDGYKIFCSMIVRATRGSFYLLGWSTIFHHC